MLKSMMLYRITSPEIARRLLDWEDLTEALEKLPAAEPVGPQWAKLGFDLPCPAFSQMLVVPGPLNSNFFTLYKHERILPGANIRKAVDKRAKAIMEREGRDKLYAKELAQLKDDVTAELLPKSHVKSSHVDVIAHGDLLIIGTSSAKRAEEVLSFLREALGTLPVRPLTFKTHVTNWLTELAQAIGDNGKFAAGTHAKLTDSEKGKLTLTDVDFVDSEDFQQHLHNGFKVSELQMTHRECLFTLTEKLVFKGIKFTDVAMVAAEAQADEGLEVYWETSATIFLSEVLDIVSGMIDRLGEDVPVGPVCEHCGVAGAHGIGCATFSLQAFAQEPDSTSSGDDDEGAEDEDDMFDTDTEDDEL